MFSPLYRASFYNMYNKQTNAHSIASVLYSSLFIAPTCFNDNASFSGSSYSAPDKLHKVSYKTT
jgi:hypothetical protein